MDERDLCRLTSAADPVEAGALRAYLEDNDVFVFVQGEHHSSMLGQLGSFAIALNVMVRRDQLERAAELLVAFREGEIIAPEGLEELALAAGDEDEHHDQGDEQEDELRLKYDLRAVTVFGCVGFGLGHFRAGAVGRALFLAAAYPAAILAYPLFGPTAFALIPMAMATDVLGARAHVVSLHRAGKCAQLPSARLLKPRQK